jgi:hypothetical protein
MFQITHALGGNAMKQFIAKFESNIQGTLSGFDRVVFRGSLRRLTHSQGMKMCLIRNGLLCKQYQDHVKEVSQELKEASLDPFRQQLPKVADRVYPRSQGGQGPDCARPRRQASVVRQKSFDIRLRIDGWSSSCSGGMYRLLKQEVAYECGTLKRTGPVPMRQATQAIAEETAIGWNGSSGNAGWFRTRGGGGGDPVFFRRPMSLRRPGAGRYCPAR